jgi:hypothetical protein
MLQSIVILLGQLNECFACFNLWIFLPPRSLDGQPEWLYVLCLSLSYAITEPIAVLVLQVSGIPPWVLTLCLGPLGASAAFIFVFAQDLEHSEHIASAKDKNGSLRQSHRQQVKRALVLLPCVLTSARNNAALLLFGQSLYAPGFNSGITSRPSSVRGRLSSVWCAAALITRSINRLVGWLSCESFVAARFGGLLLCVLLYSSACEWQCGRLLVLSLSLRFVF